MSRSHAVREGFSAVFRDPLIYGAELAWRWTYSIASLLLIAYGVLLFLNSLPVTDRDAFGLSGIIPALFAEALANIFRGSGPKMMRLALMLFLGLGILWLVAATVGRAATLSALLRKSAPWRQIYTLHLLRLMVATAAYIAYGGAIAGALSSARFDNGGGYDVAEFYLVFLVLSMIISMAWSSASWYLSLGPILAARNGTGVLDSLYDAAALLRRRASQFSWVGIFFGLLRAAIWFGGFFAFLALLGAAAEAPKGVGIALFLLFAAAYSAVSNLIYLLRMAAYVRIADWDEEEGSRRIATVPQPEALPPSPPPLVDPPVVPAM
jgi:hypothetical protein